MTTASAQAGSSSTPSTRIEPCAIVAWMVGASVALAGEALNTTRANKIIEGIVADGAVAESKKYRGTTSMLVLMMKVGSVRMGVSGRFVSMMVGVVTARRNL